MSPKRQKVKAKSLDEQMQDEMLSDGFACLEDIHGLPDRAYEWLVMGAGSPNCVQFRQNLADIAERSVLAISFYSGKGTDGTALTYFNRLIVKLGISRRKTIEQDRNCLNILSNMAYGDSAVYDHVMGKFEDRIDAGVLRQMNAFLAASEGDVEARAVAYEEIQKLLASAVAEKAFYRKETYWCHRCNQPCPMIDGRINDC